MKKSTVMIFLLSLIVFMTFKSSYAFAEEKDYYIHDLNIDVTVNDKKQCIVKERVDVHFNKKVDTFYKTINTEIGDEYINVSRVNVIGEKFDVTNSSYDNSIVIGNKDKGFSGNKEFIIEYTLDYYKRKDNNNDLFNFDVLQNTYEGDIKNFYEKINMPCNVDAKDIILSSGKYNSYGENELAVKERVSGKSIEISKNSTIEDGSSIKLKAGLNKGTFKDIPDFKYNYVIKNQDVDIHITRQQEYYVTQKYSIDIIDENAEDNYLRLMSAGSSLDKIYDFKCSSSEVNINSFYDSLELPKQKGRIDFTVSYKQKPSLDSDVKFCLYNGSKNVNVEKMKVRINSAVPMKGCNIDCDDDIKNSIKVDKTSMNIMIESRDYLNRNGMIDVEINVDKSKFTRPMKTAGLIKFLCAALCFFVSLFIYKKYCDSETIMSKKRYYVPEFMDSLKAGYLFSSEFSKKNASSLIFYWYSHKHINIESFRNSDGYNFKITKLGHLDDEHQDYEIEMFNNLFAESSEVIINKKNSSSRMYKMYSSIKKKFMNNIVNENIICEKPKVVMYIVNFTMYLSVILLIYDRINEGNDVVMKFIIYLVIGLLVLKLYSYIMKRCSIAYKNKPNGDISVKYCRIFVSVPFFFVICFMFIYKTTPFVITFMTILFLFVSICIKNCPTKGNVIYKEKLCYLLGLDDFLKEKETAELKMLVNYDEEYYYKILPYAIALGDEKNLMDRVKKIGDKVINEEKIYDYYILNCILNNRNIMM